MGGRLEGNKVNLNVGNNLNLTSLQDTDDYDYDKISASISGSYGTGASGNLALEKTDITSHWASVTDQAGIFAGKEGYNVTVGNNTNLTGAVIASEAKDPTKNKLDTGTLTFNDIENKANYKVDHVSVSVGTGGGGTFAPAAGAPAIYHKEESDKNTTHAAVSQGDIIIRDKTHQAQDVNTISRDTDNAHQTLKPIFNKEKAFETIEIIDSIRDIADQAKQLAKKYDKLQAQKEADKSLESLQEQAKKQLGKDASQEKIDALTQQLYNQKVEQILTDNSKHNLGTMGGSIDKGITAAASIATGIITGDIAGGLAGASAPYLATVIKEKTTYIDKNGKEQVDKEANLIAHAILGAAVAAVQGNSAVAGGIGAAGGEIAAQKIRELLYDNKPNDKLSEAEKENISALTQLALGIAVATATGGDMGDTGAAVSAGKNAVEHNNLAPVLNTAQKAVQTCFRIPDCRAYVVSQAVRMGSESEQVETAINAAVEFLDKQDEILQKIPPEELQAMSEGGFIFHIDDLLNSLNGISSDKTETTIAVDPNERPKLEGIPIPEQDKDSGKLINPIPDPDDSLPTHTGHGGGLDNIDIPNNTGGNQIPDKDWRDNIMTASNPYEPNKGAVGNMGEFLNQRGFGSTVKDNSRKTSRQYQGQSIYVADKDIGEIKKGDQFYLDGQHKDHIEVFDSRGKFRHVLNLDGTLNRDKTDAGRGRRISK